MAKYKFAAFIGLIIMGISSFLSCLGSTVLITNVASGFLLLSIGIMSYAFAHWQP